MTYNKTNDIVNKLTTKQTYIYNYGGKKPLQDYMSTKLHTSYVTKCWPIIDNVK